MTTKQKAPRLKNLDETQKYDIRQAVTAAARKKFFESVIQKGEDATDLSDLLMQRTRKVGDMAYEVALSKEEHEFIDSHPSWFSMKNEIELVMYTDRRKEKMHLPMSQPRRCPEFMQRQGGWHDDKDDAIKPTFFDPLSAVAIAMKDITRIREEESKHMQMVEKEILAVLGGRCNAQQVMERWPEIKTVYPAIEKMAVEASQQLVIVTKTLNAVFPSATK